MRITKNFTYEEFFSSQEAKKRGIENVPRPDDMLRVCANLFRLAVLLQRIRDYYGGPITVTSGYRCAELNSVLPGAAPNSYHLHGRAADIVASDMLKLGRCLKTIQEELFDVFEQASLFKIIKEPTWYHIQLSAVYENATLTMFEEFVNGKRNLPYQ